MFYASCSLFIIVPLALLEALALNSKLLKFRVLWRVVYFAPIVTSTVAISLVFRMLYNKDFGTFNGIIMALGGAPVNWLGDLRAAKVAVLGVVIWRWTGLLAVYFLAGLQSIPEELHEAPDYGKVGGCLITGNEDGVKHCAMNILYSLQHLGYVIPPQADAGWIGEAGPGRPISTPARAVRRTTSPTATRRS